MLGPHSCARALSSRGERGPLLAAVLGPLTAVASPAAEHRLQARGPSSCGPRAPERTQAQQPWRTGPAAPQHARSPRTRARTHVPWTGRQTPNHCAIREALWGTFLAAIYIPHFLDSKTPSIIKYAIDLIIVLERNNFCHIKCTYWLKNVSQFQKLNKKTETSYPWETENEASTSLYFQFKHIFK